MELFSWWNLVWLILIVANLALWIISRGYLKVASGHTDEAIKTYRDALEWHRKANVRYVEVEKAHERVEVILDQTQKLLELIPEPTDEVQEEAAREAHERPTSADGERKL